MPETPTNTTELTWEDASDENPGITVLYSDDSDNPGHRYVIQKKNGAAGIWRLAFRQTETDALRIIFVGQSQGECQEYAQKFKEQTAA